MLLQCCCVLISRRAWRIFCLLCVFVFPIFPRLVPSRYSAPGGGMARQHINPSWAHSACNRSVWYSVASRRRRWCNFKKKERTAALLSERLNSCPPETVWEGRSGRLFAAEYQDRQEGIIRVGGLRMNLLETAEQSRDRKGSFFMATYKDGYIKWKERKKERRG